MITNRCVIVGSGASIRENQWNIPIKDLSIWHILKNEPTISVNFNFHWLVPTIHMFSDYQFYHTQYNYLKNLPLLLTTWDAYYNPESKKGGEDKKPGGENLFFLKPCKSKHYIKAGDKKIGMHPFYWGKDSWQNGWYINQLIGILALNFAINGLGAKEIFLLGYDCCSINGHTHFYDDSDIGKYVYDNQPHYGVGQKSNGVYRTDNYNKVDELNNFWFQPFTSLWKEGIEIWNVSQESVLNIFPKISYKSFYAMLYNNRYSFNQVIIQEQIKNLTREHLC